MTARLRATALAASLSGLASLAISVPTVHAQLSTSFSADDKQGAEGKADTDGFTLKAERNTSQGMLKDLFAKAETRDPTRRSVAAEARRKAELERCLANVRRLAASGVVSADACTGPGYARPQDDAVVTRPSQDQVTAALVQSATRHLPFPGFQVQIEPAGKTLVNLDTNVYTISKPFVRTVTILTWPVKIRATPTSYKWNFGDGTTETTSTPGAPHPNALVTHKYKDRHAESGAVKVSVNVTYDTWYKLQGRPWQNAGTVSIPGPGTPLFVCEARPVLTDPDNPNPITPTPDPANPCTE